MRAIKCHYTHRKPSCGLMRWNIASMMMSCHQEPSTKLISNAALQSGCPINATQTMGNGQCATVSFVSLPQEQTHLTDCWSTSKFISVHQHKSFWLRKPISSSTGHISKYSDICSQCKTKFSCSTSDLSMTTHQINKAKCVSAHLQFFPPHNHKYYNLIRIYI